MLIRQGDITKFDDAEVIEVEESEEECTEIAQSCSDNETKPQ